MFLPGYLLHIYGSTFIHLLSYKDIAFSMTMWQEQIDANHQSKKCIRLVQGAV